MKHLILLCILLISLTSFAQKQKAKQHIAICEQGKGCEIMEIKITSEAIDKALSKPGFWINAADSATLVIENCTHKIEEKLSVIEIHQSFGGKGEPKKITDFDLAKYLQLKGCCANITKKIAFYASASGEGAHSGNGYFYLNLKAGEAFMPNDSFQQFYGSEAKGVILDQFLRNGAIDSYIIAEGQKYHAKMPIGTNISVIKNDALNEQRFKTDFRETGNTRNNLNITSTEYTGKDDDGKTMSFWIMPVHDVCLPKGKFDAFGFYNLGYISVDGITYLVTEISGSGFEIKITGISDDTYNFNPSGYKPY
ncbi:hypothetical protein FAZ15_09885 [Sphingobacterium olei]|uniref:Uncharacterized protein n=1 Tax=Sphingobacterium olei TaxID=2571155 RepID=A0A4U0P2G4_9SPHI|nr:hypothetical protein [Sphingobacterium olei]TJZ61491.1 hypothetical protein FAZ15_09885 [Sphingobacterium olei]